MKSCIGRHLALKIKKSRRFQVKRIQGFEIRHAFGYYQISGEKHFQKIVRHMIPIHASSGYTGVGHMDKPVPESRFAPIRSGLNHSRPVRP